MNEAAQLISKSLLGLDFKAVFINNKAYEIHSPTIKVMCLGLKEWAKISIDPNNQTTLSAISQIPDIMEHQLMGIAFFVAHTQANDLFEEWSQGNVTEQEINLAIDAIMSLINYEQVFRNAQRSLSAVKIIARSK